MQPELVDLDAKWLVGLPFYGDPANGAFAKVWHRLMQEKLPVPERVDEKVMYGVEVYGPEFHQERRWYYFAACEVSNPEAVTGLLFAKRLPAAKYALFRAEDGLAKLPETFRFAYDTWLPASDYVQAYPFDFELYGADYHGDTPESVVEVWIPVKPKAG